MRKSKTIQQKYFRWRVFQRPGSSIHEADGRSNPTRLGRYTLSSDWGTAMTRLKELDLIKAVEHGLADKAALLEIDVALLPLATGRDLYMKHVQRPTIVRGAKPATHRRYLPVFAKFLAFAQGRGITHWNQVSRRVLEDYSQWLDENDYAFATEYLELTTLKQACNFFIDEGHLPGKCAFDLPLERPVDTTTYCFTPAEMEAMVAHCFADASLRWLGHVITALAHLGLRISELVQIKWSDIDLEAGMITLADRTRMGTRQERRKAPSTKGGRSRSLPIHPVLRQLLVSLPCNADGRVLHGPGGQPLNADLVRTTLIRQVITPLQIRFPADPGVKSFKDGRLHSIRHYFCSTCANSGVPEQVLMRWLGHRSSRMVQRYYHLHADESKRHMLKINPLGKAHPAIGPALHQAGESTIQETPNPHEQGGMANRKTA